jgi:hypothetical protein
VFVVELAGVQAVVKLAEEFVEQASALFARDHVLPK